MLHAKISIYEDLVLACVYTIHIYININMNVCLGHFLFHHLQPAVLHVSNEIVHEGSIICK